MDARAREDGGVAAVAAARAREDEDEDEDEGEDEDEVEDGSTAPSGTANAGGDDLDAERSVTTARADARAAREGFEAMATTRTSGGIGITTRGASTREVTT